MTEIPTWLLLLGVLVAAAMELALVHVTWQVLARLRLEDA